MPNLHINFMAILFLLLVSMFQHSKIQKIDHTFELDQVSYPLVSGDVDGPVKGSCVAGMGSLMMMTLSVLKLDGIPILYDTPLMYAVHKQMQQS